MSTREREREPVFPGLPLLGLDSEVGQRHDFVVDLHHLGRGASAGAVEEICVKGECQYVSEVGYKLKTFLLWLVRALS